jgi:hypothetical protein
VNGHDIAACTLEHDAIMRWRKAARQRLIAERLSMPSDEPRRHAEAIGRHLTDALGTV